MVTLVLWDQRLEVEKMQRRLGHQPAGRRGLLQRSPAAGPAHLEPHRLGRLARRGPAAPSPPCAWPGTFCSTCWARPWCSAPCCPPSAPPSCPEASSRPSRGRCSASPGSCSGCGPGRSPTYERRDRVMAMYGPVALLLLLTSWYVLLDRWVRGPVPRRRASTPVGTAFRLSGSAVFTLGTTADPGSSPSLLTYIEAGLGLLILTLLITYLPTIYSVFAQREAAVAQLAGPGRHPPGGVDAAHPVLPHRPDGPAEPSCGSSGRAGSRPWRSPTPRSPSWPSSARRSPTSRG